MKQETKIEQSPETAKALNRLAREQMKKQLMLDIEADMAVCDIEGWSKTEYLYELEDLIHGFVREIQGKRRADTGDSAAGMDKDRESHDTAEGL